MKKRKFDRVIDDRIRDTEGKLVGTPPPKKEKYSVIQFTVPVACLNMSKPQPTGNDLFDIVSPVDSGDLREFIRVYRAFVDAGGLIVNKVDPRSNNRLLQFGVWIITDNPRPGSFVGIQSILDKLNPGLSSSDGQPTTDELSQLREMFEKAKIDVSKYKYNAFPPKSKDAISMVWIILVGMLILIVVFFR